MAEDTDVKEGEISVADFEGEQETPKESSPEKVEAESKTEPEGKDTPEDKETPETPDVSTKGEEGKPSDEDENVVPPEDKPTTKADERKTQLNTEIRDLVAQRNALKDEVTKANSDVYQPATEQELQDEGLSATDAKVEALRQQIEVKDYTDRVADAQLTIESESQRVLQDFPIFNPDSENFDQELAQEAADLLQNNLIVDQNTGQVIGSNTSPYQLYKTLARASGISTVKGQLKGQQDTEKMLANADAPNGTAPAKKASDPLMELFADPNT